MTAFDAGRPLTEAQTGLWYAQRLDRENPIFNAGQYVELRGPFDENAFRVAVERTLSESDVLALRIFESADGPRQTNDHAPSLELVDVSLERDPLAAAKAAIATRSKRAVDLANEPLASEVLFRLAPDRHLWFQRIHHVAVDGYGMALLTERVAELYEHMVAGGSAGRPLQPLSAVLAEDEAYRTSVRRAADARFWSDGFADLGEVQGLSPGRAVTAHDVHRATTVIAPAVRDALHRLATGTDASWPDVLTALVAAYARRFTGESEIVIGVPFMGRLGSASARVPAMVMNVLPVRMTPDEDQDVASFIQAASRALVRARRHGRYRSEQLRRDLRRVGAERRLYGPLVNVLPFDRTPRFADLVVERHVTSTGPVDDISFTFRGDAVSELSLEVDSNPTLYSQAETEAHAARLTRFLEIAVEARSLSLVPTATEAEAERELSVWNDTAHVVPDTTVAQLIEESFSRTPEALALRFESVDVSYAELDRRSAALAAALRRRGAGPGSIIAVALPRSIELLVAIIAIVRSGAAYLPLDLEHPRARVEVILNRASPLAVVAFDDPHDLYGARHIAPDASDVMSDAVPAAPTDPAYVIFTSGSTGEPKGVVVSHRAIVNRLLWMREQYRFEASDRFLQKTPVTFDVSVWELFLPFLSGGALVIAPPGAHRDPSAIAALVRDEGVTTVHFVPSMLAAFLEAPPSEGLSIARVFCSGEELTADLRDRFHARMQGDLHNLYGPTEAAVDVSYWAAPPTDLSGPVPIGHPVWNTRLVILDERRRPTPPGFTGELYLGGVQLAEGYLGRPDLTAERFIPDPYRSKERLYATGDLARRREDGAIVFLGRADHQIKLRGLRIELGEIEAQIAATGLTRGAAVVVRDGRLVAYFLAGEAKPFSEASFRASLARVLPDYMVPAAIVMLDRFPTTSSGKLDRKALPAPAFESRGGEEPRGETERVLARLFAEMLGRDEAVSAGDDFFALGGDSLSAVRLLARVRASFGVDPGLAAVFEHTTVRTLASRIDDAAQGVASNVDEGLAPRITLVRGDDTLPPLFVVHPAGGICWGYRTLARALAPSRTVYGLQAPTLAAGSPSPPSIDAIAADYATRIIDTAPHGPYHVAGWSVGGIIAQAIGVELRARGREVGLVAMLDSYPAECWRAEPEPTSTAALRSLLSIAGYDPERYPDLQTREAITSFLRAGDSALGNLPAAALDGVIRVVLDTNRLVRAHHHQTLDGVLTHVRAGADHVARPELVPSLWERYARRLDRITVPFLHPQLTGPEATERIAPELSKRMTAFERPTSASFSLELGA